MTWDQAGALEASLNLSFPLLIAGLPPTNLDAFIFLCNHEYLLPFSHLFIYDYCCEKIYYH